MSSAMPAEMPAIPLPPEPQTIEQTGLTLGFLADLALKTLYLRGQMSMADIASALGLSITGVTDKIMEFLKTERLVEIRGGAGISSASYQFVIVDRGSEKAQEALARSQYVGENLIGRRERRCAGELLDAVDLSPKPAPRIGLTPVTAASTLRSYGRPNSA